MYSFLSTEYHIHARYSICAIPIPTNQFHSFLYYSITHSNIRIEYVIYLWVGYRVYLSARENHFLSQIEIQFLVLWWVKCKRINSICECLLIDSDSLEGSLFFLPLAFFYTTLTSIFLVANISPWWYCRTWCYINECHTQIKHKPRESNPCSGEYTSMLLFHTRVWHLMSLILIFRRQRSRNWRTHGAFSNGRKRRYSLSL